MLEFQVNVSYFLEIVLTDSDGKFVTGETVTYDIYNSDTNASIFSGTMTSEGNIYKAEVTFTTAGQYRVFYNTPAGFEDGSESILVSTSSASAIADAVWNALTSNHSTVNSFADLIKRVAGLCQENYRVINPVYDVRGNMTSGTIKIYPSAADVSANTNAIATYAIAATYNVQNRTTDYQVSKV